VIGSTISSAVVPTPITSSSRPMSQIVAPTPAPVPVIAPAPVKQPQQQQTAQAVPKVAKGLWASIAKGPPVVEKIPEPVRVVEKPKPIPTTADNFPPAISTTQRQQPKQAQKPAPTPSTSTQAIGQKQQTTEIKKPTPTATTTAPTITAATITTTVPSTTTSAPIKAPEPTKPLQPVGRAPEPVVTLPTAATTISKPRTMQNNTTNNNNNNNTINNNQSRHRQQMQSQSRPVQTVKMPTAPKQSGLEVQFGAGDYDNKSSFTTFGDTSSISAVSSTNVVSQDIGGLHKSEDSLLPEPSNELANNGTSQAVDAPTISKPTRVAPAPMPPATLSSVSSQPIQNSLARGGVGDLPQGAVQPSPVDRGGYTNGSSTGATNNTNNTNNSNNNSNTNPNANANANTNNNNNANNSNANISAGSTTSTSNGAAGNGGNGGNGQMQQQFNNDNWNSQMPMSMYQGLPFPQMSGFGMMPSAYAPFEPTDPRMSNPYLGDGNMQGAAPGMYGQQQRDAFSTHQAQQPRGDNAAQGSNQQSSYQGSNSRDKYSNARGSTNSRNQPPQQAEVPTQGQGLGTAPNNPMQQTFAPQMGGMNLMPFPPYPQQPYGMPYYPPGMNQAMGQGYNSNSGYLLAQNTHAAMKGHPNSIPFTSFQQQMERQPQHSYGGATNGQQGQATPLGGSTQPPHEGQPQQQQKYDARQAYNNSMGAMENSNYETLSSSYLGGGGGNQQQGKSSQNQKQQSSSSPGVNPSDMSGYGKSNKVDSSRAPSQQTNSFQQGRYSGQQQQNQQRSMQYMNANMPFTNQNYQ